MTSELPWFEEDKKQLSQRGLQVLTASAICYDDLAWTAVPKSVLVVNEYTIGEKYNMTHVP